MKIPQPFHARTADAVIPGGARSLPADTPLILRPWARILKRFVDVTLALLMLLLIAPWLFPPVMLLIVLETPGNPFFLQKRTGRNRKAFRCIKFRTMVPNPDSHRLQVQVNDLRITRVGHFLRKHHIDELPQVLNVLAGSMSIVGPRPYMLRQCVEFSRMSPRYRERQIVKPGMTGLAQVRGYHGMVNDEEHFRQRLEADLEYIRTWSPWLDIRIFIGTTVQSIFQW